MQDLYESLSLYLSIIVHGAMLLPVDYTGCNLRFLWGVGMPWSKVSDDPCVFMSTSGRHLFRMQTRCLGTRLVLLSWDEWVVLLKHSCLSSRSLSAICNPTLCWCLPRWFNVEIASHCPCNWPLLFETTAWMNSCVFWTTFLLMISFGFGSGGWR